MISNGNMFRQRFVSQSLGREHGIYSQSTLGCATWRLYFRPFKHWRSTPVHVHHVENEWFYAIEGEYEVKVGDDIFHLKPGGSVYAPKLVPHAISDVSEKGGKMIVVAQPAGHIEAFSVDLFKVISSSTHDEAAIKAVFLKHDMDIVGPQLPKKHQTR